MTSDPHPEHDDCDEINHVGLLTPGQRTETGNLNDGPHCGFHDHDNRFPTCKDLAGTDSGSVVRGSRDRQLPVNFGFRFSRNAAVPSCLSAES